MAKFDVVNLDLKKVGELELSDEVFGAEPNKNLFYEVAKAQQINRRRGTVMVKNSSLTMEQAQGANNFRRFPAFQGIPIRRVDAIAADEARVV